MNKVMILGAGRGQIPIMNLCHKYGWYVIAVSPEGNYPGIKVADEMCFINVQDKEAVLVAAKQKAIQAIMTDQLDAGVLTAAFVAENMGLKGITSEVALKFTNKFVMRQAAKEAGINVPFAVCVSEEEELDKVLGDNQELRFPMMIKPVDSSASRGVYKVKSLEEARIKFRESRNCSRSRKVIVEQFVEGKEFVVEAFTSDYEVTNLIVGHRDYFQIQDTFIPNATVFTDADSANSELEERLKETNKKIIESFKLSFGITHGEYMYNPIDDKIYLIEIAARGGGVFISSDLIPKASGVDANDLLVRKVLGIKCCDKIKLKKGAAAYFCYLIPEGKVVLMNNTEKVNNMQGVIHGFFDNIEVGMISKTITDKSSRKGPILVGGTTKKECYDVIDRIKGILDIKIEFEGEYKDAIWS